MARLRFLLPLLVALFALLTLAERFVLVEMFVRRLAVPIGLALVEALAIAAVGMLVRSVGAQSATHPPRSLDSAANDTQRNATPPHPPSAPSPPRGEGSRSRTSNRYLEVSNPNLESRAFSPPGEKVPKADEGVVSHPHHRRLRRSLARDDMALDFLVGYPIFGTLCFLVGLVKISAWTMLPLVIAGAIAWPLVRARAEVRGSKLEVRNGATSNLAAALAVAIVLACGFVIAQAPPVSLDEVAYHLAVPRAWAVEGRAVELPLLSHSYFPLGIESADLPLLATLAENGGIASHFLHLIAAIAAIALIVRRTSSWLATAAIVTTPALAVTTGWSLVEWPMIGICVALVIALEDDDDRTATAATAAGLLTKYTFLPFALLVYAASRKWRPALPALVIGSVFFIRNLVLTGNPVAPFFGAAAPHGVAGYRGAYLADYIFEGTFIDESLGASLLGMAFGASGPIAWASLAGSLALFILGPSSRILLPFLAVAAMSAAPLFKRRLFAFVIAAAVLLQTFFIVWSTERSGAFGLLSGRVTEQEYVAAQRNTFPAIAWLNATLPEESRTLVIGQGETFWFSRRVRGGGNFDGERLSRYLAASTPEALRERLRRDGITHVAILATPPPTRVAKKIEERVARLTPDAQRMLAQTLNRYTATVATRGADTLFTLRP